MLSATGTKLLDFGIAKHVSLPLAQDTAATLPDVTNPGTFLGAPRYASPEQFRGHPLDARSDLFSVGVIFYEMLTGQAPFPGESFGEIAHSVLQGSVPALRLARHFRHGTHCASCAGARSQGSTGVGPLGPRPVAHRQVQGRLGGGIAVG